MAIDKSQSCLITGVNGQLGYDLAKQAIALGYSVLGLGREEQSDIAGIEYQTVDLLDVSALQAVVEAFHPKVIFHCAAWTAVDLAEDAEHFETVRAINVEATRRLAQLAKYLGAKLVYVSTDYVFDGSGHAPWTEDCKNLAPLNVYGKSKLDGEGEVREILREHFIVRTSWVYGSHGQNFVNTMLALSKKLSNLRVVKDQVGRPTYTVDLASFLLSLVQSEAYGTYHACNTGDFISWYDFAVEIFLQSGIAMEVLPVSTAEYGVSKAQRPFNSRLDCGKMLREGFAPLPNWKDALHRYLQEIKVVG